MKNPDEQLLTFVASCFLGALPPAEHQEKTTVKLASRWTNMHLEPLLCFKYIVLKHSISDPASYMGILLSKRKQVETVFANTRRGFLEGVC
jgi:hypothetical protein